MQGGHSTSDVTPDQASGQNPRRHPRSTVLKAATVHPLLREAGFLIGNVSQLGVMGRCALPLSLSQCVHLTFDGREFLAAEVRWAQGDRYGLQLAEPRVGVSGLSDWETIDRETIDGMTARAQRIPTNMTATLVTTLPMLPGLVRNLSRGGMLIEIGTRLREGERLLVKMRDQPTFIGRVQWSKQGCAGLEFAHELPSEIVPDGGLSTERPADDRNDMRMEE